MSPDPPASPLLPARTPPPALRTVLVVILLYLFLVGVALLETGIAALGDGFRQGLLENVANPISGLFAGILATVLVQSSSVSTATIVGLVGSGVLPVELAVPMIMGANIGTTITNTLASLGSIRRSEDFRRGFAAATMHDFFNLLAVALLLPIELTTRVISRTAARLTEVLRTADFDPARPPRSPIREAVKFPVRLLEDILHPERMIPAIAGLVLLALGLTLIFLALTFITRNMRRLVAGGVERAMNRVIGRGGGAIGLLVGVVMTVAVQSSSITTSILVPLVAAGILTLPNAYPITLGANLGTTVTALIASLAVVQPGGLTIALVHTLFNAAAIALVYPVKRIRLFPVRLAQGLADLAVRRRSVVAVYIVGLFLVIPTLGIFLIP